MTELIRPALYGAFHLVENISSNEPNENPIPNFTDYFKTYSENLILRKDQCLHFELG